MLTSFNNRLREPLALILETRYIRNNCSLSLFNCVVMLFVGRLPIKKIRWLAMHVCLGILVILNAVFILLPVGTEILEASQNIVMGVGSMADFYQLKNSEAIFGALNIILCLILVSLAVVKPKLGEK